MTEVRTACAGLSFALLMFLTMFVMNADHEVTLGQSDHATWRSAVTAIQPVAVVSASATDVVNGTLVHFDGSGSTSQQGIANWTWNYTRGSENVYFYGSVIPWMADEVFDLVGNFTVTLTVLDVASLTAATSVVIHVKPASGANNPPVAEAGHDLYRPIEWYDWLDGLGSTDDQGIANYAWTYMDNGVRFNLSGPIVIVGFKIAGTYTITLTVTDVGGLTATDTLTDYVSGTDWMPAQAEAGSDQTVGVGEKVTFDGSGSTGMGILNYTWMLIDGGVVQLFGIKPTHTFLIPGDYTVNLDLYDSDYWTSSDALTVHVLPHTNSPPHADAGYDATIQSGTTFQFNGSGCRDDEPGLDYLWNFIHRGIHEILHGVSPTFQFTKQGIYLVNLTVADAGGLSDSDTVAITVTNSVDTSNASFLEKYGVWLIIGGAETALVALAALVVMRRRSSRKT